ncbi:MAG: aminopeptidase P family protein [Coriobacteriia bacterium]|nr:aminopeptidase P family protein [Coriobacteriia bacterium]
MSPAQSGDRLSRIRASMKQEGLDALIINYSTNVVYATGFDGIADVENPHIALVTADRAIALIDSRYFEVASGQAAAHNFEVILARHEVRERAVEMIDQLAPVRIGIEDTMGYGQFLKWKEALEGREIVATHRLIEDVREIKDREEIARIEQAQRITDEAFTHMLEFIKPGQTESEVALELEFTLRRLGAEAMAFEPIVAAGANGSMPHAKPGGYRLQIGDLLTMDFGAQFKGYKADMTRTICVGQASALQKEIYAIVLDAQLNAIEAVRAGARSADVDAAARTIIDNAGYGEQFGHGTGHGIGLDVHELPSLKPISEGTIKAGSVTSIEPGIYLEGVLGVRIEDLVVVTDQGYQMLTGSPKELIELAV